MTQFVEDQAVRLRNPQIIDEFYVTPEMYGTVLEVEDAGIYVEFTVSEYVTVRELMAEYQLETF